MSKLILAQSDNLTTDRYSSLSDSQINEIVARRFQISSSKFEPCKNASDAWQIILDNKISITEDGGAWEASIDFVSPTGSHGTNEILTKFYECENPLRAAMMVCLMMWDRKDEINNTQR